MLFSTVMTLGRFTFSIMSLHMSIKVTFTRCSVVTHAANSYVCLVMGFYMANYTRIVTCPKSTEGAFVFVGCRIFKIKTRI